MSAPPPLEALLPRLARFVTAAQRQALRFTSPLPIALLEEVYQRQVSLRHHLATYLPRLLVEDNPAPRLSHGRYLTGTVLFADLTGFTPITEAAAEEGAAGLERLNTLMNRLFEHILHCVIYTGGDLLSFQGDAAMALFPEHPDDEDVLWAVRAGLRMQRVLAPFNTPPTPLRMRVGVARGTFYMAQVGDDARREIFLCGGPMSEAIRCEHDATPGRVLVAAAHRALVERHFHTDALPDGRVHIADDLGDALDDYEIAPVQRRGTSLVLDRSPEHLLHLIAEALLSVEALAPFFPAPVLSRIIDGLSQRRIQAEHRPVAIAFADLIGLAGLVDALRDYPQAHETLLDLLRHYALAAFSATNDLEGIVSHVDPVQSGVTVLGVFGAPLAVEGTPYRAVAAAQRMRVAMQELNALFADRFGSLPGVEVPRLQQRIGVTYGPIFTGEVGSVNRRNYVTVGDDVILAARLMAKAEAGQILVSPRVHRRTIGSFVYQALDPIRLKGMSEPMRPHAVQRPRAHVDWLLAANQKPIVGREAALAALTRLLDLGGSALVVGEAGIGKTRLVAALAERAQGAGWKVLAGRCFSEAGRRPFSPWTAIVREALDLGDDDPHARALLRARLVEQGLGEHAGPLMGLAALSVAVPVSAPKAPAQADSLFDLIRANTAGSPSRGPRSRGSQRPLDLQQLLRDRLAGGAASEPAEHPSDDDRAPGGGVDLQRLVSDRTDPALALIHLLALEFEAAPVLLIVEDVQWADPESLRLLRYLTAPRQPRLLIVLTADRHPGQGLKLDETLLLEPLAAAAVATLARLVLGDRVEPTLVAWLLRTTGGNPLFLHELLVTLAEQGAASSADWQSGALTFLAAGPTSAREVLLGRLDSLPEEARQLIERAAVIGRTVPARWLDQLIPDAAARRTALRRLAGEGLLTPPPPAPVYEFAHELLREVVYTHLALSDRQRWHRELADWLATRRQVPMESVLDHYQRAGALDQAGEWALRAGHQALADILPDLAAHYFQQAMALAPDDTIRQQAQAALEKLPFGAGM